MQLKKSCTRISEAAAKIEGKAEGSWVLHDYGDVIVHIFLPQEREFYRLEAFGDTPNALNFRFIPHKSNDI